MSVTKSAPNKTFVAKVLDFLKGGDEAKVSRFHRLARKHAQTQIRLFEEEIEKLEDQLADRQEELQESVLSIDLEAISTSTNARDYIPEYFKKIRAMKVSINDIEEKIESQKKQIDNYKEVLTLLGD